MRQTGFFSDDIFRAHEMGPGNPECPARLDAIEEELIASGLAASVQHFGSVVASYPDVLCAHSETYLTELRAQSPESGYAQVGADTSINAHTLEAARRAAGVVVNAVDKVLEGTCSNAFCAVRPPGHHAHRDHTAGFCFLNNVAIGALHALGCGLKRVAIADFDAHYGDGTENIVAGDSRILFLNLFQDGIYPFHAVSDAANVLDVPLAAGASGRELRGALEERWLPALDAFRPEFLFVSAGFDGHTDEQQAQLKFTELDYAYLTRRLMDVADAHCDGRLVSVLEGGYALRSLARSVVAHVKTLAGL